ncbi:MAG TPA: tripartite tricarboxylate transporter substrate binding protein [Pseudolabrys sp.]|nr:tripartite tricarboxylate transporter substrate binding protein [Pseudolabrys sp.]
MQLPGVSAMKPSAVTSIFSACIAFAASGSLPSPALCQPAAYPARPITLIVPFAPGGGIDIVARVLAGKLQEKMHQPVVVENRPGGGGIVGTAAVAHAMPDGYTLLMIEASSVMAKWLHKDVPFQVENDFSPVAMVATNYLGLFANSSLPVGNIAELVAYSKAHPGKLSVGTPGVGSPHHLAAMMLNHAAGIDIVHVAYRGTPPSVTDLINGQIPLVWAVPLNVMPLVAQGKAKLLALSAPRRLEAFPGIAVVAESVPGFDVTLWVGVAAPAGTPPEIVAGLAQAIHEVTALADVRERLSTLGYTLDFRSGDQFRAQMLADQKKYGDVIRAAGIQPK